MADLSQFFEVAPLNASFMMGQQFGQERDTEAIKQRELEQLIAQRTAQEARNSELHPFELDQRRLANQTTEAQLPGVQATSTLKGLEARMAGENYDVNSAAARAKAEGDSVDERVKKARKIQEYLSDVGPELSYVPPALRAQHVRERASQAGFNPESPHVQKMVQLVAQYPDKAPQILQQMNDRIGAQMADRTQPHQTAKLSRDSAERIAAGHDKTNLEIAKLRGQNKGGARSAQDMLDKALVSGRWDQAATAYDYLAQDAARNNDPDQAEYYQRKSKEYADKFMQSRAGGAPRAGSLDMSQIADMPTNPAPTTQAPALPGPQKGTKENPIVLK